ncbi:MAG: 23S rRNA (adenine(2503)-C(2))-methyltransferase RlmN [Thermoanaerobaculaceae bacterium]|nr:23S rRNA (adenine(2503)-C(2))-methyltransferase RlmN [Thermoanaerobaculaceae bacterium]MDI9620828.1 23S rRNA (adenine(2503)-C(2))-methyltransferase RlmN [Acidobacteriota bacterium]NLH12579.1 23S rRNA (adenine(2503)-C(2))-methyltransferase RlmN [Holophagae bacterium]HPW54696.1 23S rRNA (adenine(2503)-C(2))-methyltransferase RlmN [Thermoanaerobaculaceae bacterium]
MTRSPDLRYNLVGATRSEIAALLGDIDPRPYRVEQVYHWMVRRLAASLDDMTSLPKALRLSLAARAVVHDPVIVEELKASDGTVKLALGYDDGVVIEAVVMAMEGHATICLSSQAGCAVGCRFCVTGAFGPGRHLSGGEIFGQYRAIVRYANLVGRPLNVVFMGMGEPLLNFDALARSLELLAETVSLRRVTVSTSGIVPGLERLARLDRRPNLAVSLNATTQKQRSYLMPGAARWPLSELLAALRAYPLERGRRITIEYVLLEGFNDSPEDARRLPLLLRGLPVKVNLIPFNPDSVHLPGLVAPGDERINAFAAQLAAAHLNVTVRWSKGRDVGAACGQLRSRHVTDRA